MTTPRRNFTAADGVSLKEYFDTRLDAVQMSTDLAARSLESRLSQMNEIREAMREQAARSPSRDEVSILIDKLASETRIEIRKICADINDLKLSRAELHGKASQSSLNISMALALLGLLFGLINIVWMFVAP